MATATSALIPSAEIAAKAGRVEGFWGSALRQLTRNKLAVISAVFIIVLGLSAIIVPEIYPRTYAEQNYDAITQGPSWQYPMGTDQLGRDIFIRLIFGARISLTVGLVVQAVILLIGVPAGLVAGYFGGKLDKILMRTVDALYSITSLLFV